MDILIRNVDEICVKQIDELAAQSHISRNEYLKNLIEDFCDNKCLADESIVTNELLKELATALIRNTDVLQSVLSMFDEDD